MKKRILAVLMAGAMAATLVGCGAKTDAPATTDTTKTEDTTADATADATTDDTATTDDSAAASAIDNLIAATEGTVDLTLWCSETEAYQTVMAQLVDEFKATYPDVDFNITIGSESEANCKDDVLKDVEAAADVFVFADDQLNELVQAGALQSVDATFTYDPATANGQATVDAASLNGKLYAYPLTASNGYFLYYDSNVLSAEDVSSWESMVAAAEAAGKNVGFDFGNVWYTYGFFSGAGLTATLADDGVNTVCDWNSTSNSPTGADVANAIMDIASSNAVVAINNGDAMTQFADGTLAAYVDGTWDSGTVEAALGDGYAAAKLPTFQAGGQTIQMGSFAGYKLVGVNAYSKNTGWAMLLAEYITSESSQLAIGTAVGEGPSNTVAAEQISSPALSALGQQAAYANLQRVGGNFWESGNTLGQSLYEGGVDAQEALDTAVAGITAPVQ